MYLSIIYKEILIQRGHGDRASSETILKVSTYFKDAYSEFSDSHFL